LNVIGRLAGVPAEGLCVGWPLTPVSQARTG
jgi:hypothetical protein